MNQAPDVCHTVVVGTRLVLWRAGTTPQRRCTFTPIRRLTLLGWPRDDGSIGPKKQIKLCGVHYETMFAAITAQRIAIIEDVRIARDWARDGDRASAGS